MRLVGEELETSAPGAGERADVLLLASGPKGDSDPKVLGIAYHTTNVPYGTASMRRGQPYPESRILWRQYILLPGLMEEAATAVAVRAGFKSPGPPTTLPDAEEWKTALSATPRQDDQMSDATVASDDGEGTKVNLVDFGADSD